MKKKLITAILGVGIALGTSASVTAETRAEFCRSEFKACLEYLPSYICGTDYRECMGFI